MKYINPDKQIVGEGDCFSITGRAALNNRSNNDLLVCHGNVEGRGSLSGLTFVHAWIETNDGYVLDYSNGKSDRIYRPAYYEFGRIDKNEVKKYSFQEARAFMRRTLHFGPWELKPEVKTKTY